MRCINNSLRHIMILIFLLIMLFCGLQKTVNKHSVSFTLRLPSDDTKANVSLLDAILSSSVFLMSGNLDRAVEICCSVIKASLQ